MIQWYQGLTDSDTVVLELTDTVVGRVIQWYQGLTDSDTVVGRE